MDNRKETIKLYAAPELRHPYLVTGWSGMGAVALLAANFLRQELDAEILGEIEAHEFFSPSQVHIKDRLIQVPEFPESKFYFWQKGAAHDLIFFIGTEQPSRGYEMALLVLEVAEQFGVERIYTGAAFPTLIHHRQTPGVWGTATHPDLLARMEAHGVQIMEQGTIGGLNGLLLATARERGIEGLCLLGEVPIYATQMINPQASLAVLDVLTRMLHVEINVAKMTLWTEDLASQMDRLYEILPDHVKQAIESAERTVTPPTLSTTPELVADEAFFDEIERFLQQHWRQKGGEEESEEGPLS